MVGAIIVATGGAGGLEADVAGTTSDNMAAEVPQAHAHVFKGCVVIAGMCHILNNADCDVDMAMPHWKTFEKQLQSLHKLVGTKMHLDRFTERCLENTPFAVAARFFAHPVGKVAEWSQ